MAIHSPRQSIFAPSSGGTIQWDNGSSFDGFLLVQLAYPIDTNGLTWPTMSKGAGSLPRQRLPQGCKIPITDGNFDQNSRLWYNADIDPPNSQYFAWFYTNENKQIAGPTDAFQITMPTTLIDVPTLPAPALNFTPPAPIAYPGD